MWRRVNTCSRHPTGSGAGWRRIASLAVVGLMTMVLCGSGRADVKAGDTFPTLQTAGVVALTGVVPDTAGKVVLVDFWASWCAPCKASFPVMAKLQADYASRGLVIAAVSIDDKSAAAAAFAKKMAPPFSTLHDGGHKLVEQVVVPTMPTSYLIGRDGRVRYVHAGFHDGTEKELRQQIEALLAEKAASS